MSIWHLYGKCLDCGAEPLAACRDDDDRETELCDDRPLLPAVKPMSERGRRSWETRRAAGEDVVAMQAARARRPQSTPSRRRREMAPCACGRVRLGNEDHCGRRICRPPAVVRCFFCGVVMETRTDMPDRRATAKRAKCKDPVCVRENNRLHMQEKRRESESLGNL